MPVLTMIDMPGVTVEQYERVNELMGIGDGDKAPKGLIEHVAGADENGMTVVDVWESEEALRAFVEGRLRPALAAAGIEPSDEGPRVHPIHNRLDGAGSEPGVMVLIEVDDQGRQAYEKMITTMDAHAGDGSNHPSVSHTAARTDDGGLLVVDVWESPDAFGKFAEEEIGPAGAEAGLGPIEPRMVPVHNTIRGKAGVRR
jgi:heme-degrading monooxygenase HmoA